jgi:methylthioribose-1-phosphate isomerase
MKTKETGNRSIWLGEDDIVSVVDQTRLPFEYVTVQLLRSRDYVEAIRGMVVRGAPLIGVTAAFGVFQAAKEAPERGWREYVESRAEELAATRPTAVNLRWALRRVFDACSRASSRVDFVDASRAEALAMAEEDAENCRMIGVHGLPLIRAAAEKKGGTVNILTHCNAGSLACVDWGTATSPIYAAHEAGIPVHVWVDETRPRNQGASLTAWELGRRGVEHTLVCDNTGGHLMQHGMVDLVITGADRVTARGDAANKIGTYLKALAARDNGVPFYIALPSSSFDFGIDDGLAEIPIEERDEDEVRYVHGLYEGRRVSMLICPETTRAANYGFDVTPAHLIDGLVTERGLCRAERDDIARLFPDARGKGRV